MMGSTMKATLIVLLMVAVATQGSDHFTKRFAYTQVMAKCLGEKTYYDWLGTVLKAIKECHGEPMKMHKHHGHHDHHGHHNGYEEDMVANLAELLKGDRPVILPLLLSKDGQGHSSRHAFQIPLDYLSNRQKREVLYDAPILKHLLHKAMSKVSNFTCVLEKMEIVDEDLNLQVDTMKEQMENLTPNAELNQDLVKGIDHCHKFSMCLPDNGSPMPMDIKRALVFMKCNKKMRMAICMKQDILNYLEIFDVTELPFETEDEGELAEKLLHILWGSEAQEDFEVY